MDEFIYSAIAIAKNMGVKVCDCYSRWKKLYEHGVDTTQLLINRINHPNTQMILQIFVLIYLIFFL